MTIAFPEHPKMFAKVNSVRFLFQSRTLWAGVDVGGRVRGAVAGRFGPFLVGARSAASVRMAKPCWGAQYSVRSRWYLLVVALRVVSSGGSTSSTGSSGSSMAVVVRG